MASTSRPPRRSLRITRATVRAVPLVLESMSVVAIVGSALALSVFVLNPDLAEEFTSGLRPSLFFAPLAEDELRPELEPRYAEVIGVAHNSGDSVDATLSALAAGADAIEIDVVSLDGELYSSHASPLPLVGGRLFRGPRLDMVWAAAARTDLVKFDLKETSSAYVELVLAFLRERRGDHQVIVASRNTKVLRTFAERMPEVIRLYSVGGAAQLDRLYGDPRLVELVDGVTIQESLVDAETARWLQVRDLRILAWTVNDLGRANELMGMGVDAITTDNLALLSLFGGQRRAESDLDQDAVPIATPAAAPATSSTTSRRGAVRRPRPRQRRTGRWATARDVRAKPGDLPAEGPYACVPFAPV